MARSGRTPPRRTVFVSVSPGLEAVLAEELRDLGLSPSPEEGGVVVRGEERDVVYRLHLHSRVAARATVRLGTARAENLDALARAVRGMAWRDFVWPGQAVEVRASSRGSRLRFTDAVQRKVAHAVQDALRGPRLPGPRPPREPALVVVRVVDDRATISVDASGELLHRRGWRLATAKAPLRENLAAGVLRLAGWRPGEPVVDPMCGSGTFCIEAAGMALGHAPGARRAFAFERWPGFDARAWQALKARAARGVAPDPVPGAPIAAGDRDPGAVRATLANAERAGVAGRLLLAEASLYELEAPAPSGLLVMNPPYGARIGGRADLPEQWAGYGRALRARWGGWRVAVLVPARRLAEALGLPLKEIGGFSHGGIRVTVHAGPVGHGSEGPDGI